MSADDRQHLLNILYISVFLVATAIGTPMMLVSVQAENMGASLLDIGLMGTAAAAVYTIMTLVAGALLDRYEKLRIYLAFNILSAGCLAYLIFAGNIEQIFISRVLIGFAGGAFWAAAGAITADLAPPDILTRSIGMYNLSWILGFVVGPLAGGWVADTYGYPTLWGILTAFMLAALAVNGYMIPKIRLESESKEIKFDFTAVSTGATWKDKLWSMTGRGEFRDGEQEDKAGLLWGFYHEESPGYGLSSVFRHFDTERANGSENRRSELEFSLARRPVESQWIILDKAKLSEEKDSSGGVSTRTRKLVNNLNANYRPDLRNQVSINHGVKYVIDHFDGAEYDGLTQFLAVEYRHDLNKEWDLGVQSAARVSSVGDSGLYSAGVSVGHSLVKNVWLSVGYNFSGFRDDDFSGADYTAQGIYLKCRAKFDQNTARQLLAWWEK